MCGSCCFPTRRALETVRTMKVVKSDAEWRRQRRRYAFNVARHGQTERPSRRVLEPAREGPSAACAATRLFQLGRRVRLRHRLAELLAAHRQENVKTHASRSLSFIEGEVTCPLFDAHLGDVFDDGRARPCATASTSFSLRFVKARAQAMLLRRPPGRGYRCCRSRRRLPAAPDRFRMTTYFARVVESPRRRPAQSSACRCRRRTRCRQPACDSRWVRRSARTSPPANALSSYLLDGHAPFDRRLIRRHFRRVLGVQGRDCLCVSGNRDLDIHVGHGPDRRLDGRAPAGGFGVDCAALARERGDHDDRRQ